MPEQLPDRQLDAWAERHGQKRCFARFLHSAKMALIRGSFFRVIVVWLLKPVTVSAEDDFFLVHTAHSLFAEDV